MAAFILRFFKPLIALAIFVVLVSSDLFGVDPTGTPLLGADPLAAFGLTNSTSASLTTVDVTGQSFTRALRAQTLADLSPSWAAEVSAGIPQAVSSGDVVMFRFFARATQTTDETGAAFLRIAVQKRTADYSKSYDSTITITPEWNEYLIPFAFNADYATNASGFALGIGFKRQTIEIGGMQVIYYGKTVTLESLPKSGFTYAGREAGAAWRTEALARIEQIRKGDFTIRVTDNDGNPIPNATVRVTLQRHAFHFGCAYAFSRLANDLPENRIFRQKILELFNSGSPGNDLKWGPWTGEWGSGYNQTQTFRALRWLKNHGLHVRGHVLVWPGWSNLPVAIRNLRGTAQQSTIPQLVLDHIKDIVGATRELIDEWDVLNEPYTNHDLMDLFGADIQADWFKEARKYHETAPLYLNDYQNHDQSRDPGRVASFENTANFILGKQAPLSGLGIQAHFGANPTPPVTLIFTMNRYSALGLPIRITEFDVDTDDTALQADYTRDFYIAMFSQPSVVGVQMWGFWEKDHWRPNAAMYRSDWTEKPNAVAYKELVLNQWKTKAEGTTNASGAWSSRGFYGDYHVVVESGGQSYEKTFSIRSGQAAPTVVIPLVRPRIIGLATRAVAGSGDETFIAGFITNGSTPKKFIVRAVGPGLVDAFVTNFLPDPEMRMVRLPDGTTLGSNYGWNSSPDVEQIRQTTAALGMGPLREGGQDSCMLVEVAAGGCTFPVASKTGRSGVAVIEAYEADKTDPSRFSILASRAYSGTGENVAFAGFVLEGRTARTLLIRALGPALANAISGNLLAQPSLIVASGGKPIASNWNWQCSPDPVALQAAMDRAYASKLTADSVDSAYVGCFEPGAYVVTIKGADEGTGICMIEIYDLGPL